MNKEASHKPATTLTASKPWEDEGCDRATWYRRRARAGIKRRPYASKADREGLIKQIIGFLKETSPMTVRQLFYKCTSPKNPVPVPKNDSGYSRIQRLLVELRRDKTIDYRAIIDSTREGRHVHFFENIGDLIRAASWNLRTDPWKDSATLVQVWTESRSIGGFVEAAGSGAAASALLGTRSWSR